MNCHSCRLPHHGVEQTKDIRRNARRCSHIRAVCQQRRKSMQLPHAGARNFRRSISRDVANTMAACIVGTRLDYRNALLYVATEKSLNKLQRVQ